MYLIHIYKNGVLQHTDIESREVAIALSRVIRRLSNAGLSARIEEM